MLSLLLLAVLVLLHGHDPVHTNLHHLPHSALPHQPRTAHQLLAMSEPLSGTELAKLLLEHCNKIAKDERDYNREIAKEERKHNNSMLQIVAKGLGNQASLQVTNLSDHVLKTDTLNRYLEERVSSLEQTIFHIKLSQSCPTCAQLPMTSPPPQCSTPLHSSPSTPASAASSTYPATVHLQNSQIQFLQPSLVLPDPVSMSYTGPGETSPTHLSLQSASQHSCPDMSDNPFIQVDGNMTLSNLSDPAIISAGSSNASLSNQPAPPAMQYSFTLNSVNQAKRLFENTSRPPLTIRYNNPQSVNGKSHPTSVSIDCNSGVYLSAVKPALERIAPGWQLQLMNTLIQCEEVSPRNEISGRKVCTKLVLYLTETSNPEQRAKTVIHFYHTSNSVQVQGSHVMTTGVSSPVWLVTNFLEPLASNHTTKIKAINNHIQSNTFHCNSCKLPLNPAATNPKDQQLACNKCLHLFHKKCTDRKKTTANWRKSPWFCEDCITGSQITPPISQQSSLPLSSTTPAENSIRQSRLSTISGCTSAVVATPVMASLASASSQVTSLAHAPQRQSPPREGISSVEINRSIELLTSSLSPVAPEFLPQSVRLLPQGSLNTSLSPPQAMLNPLTSGQEALQVSSVSQTGQQPQPKFPSNASRQRTFNVLVTNPEAEFNKTALDSCRSTIAQQEADLKRLNETLDLRTKRIMQLDSQVGVAANYIASRETIAENTTSAVNNEGFLKINDSLNLLLAKITALVDQQNTKSQQVNVYNSACSPPKPTMVDKDCQTQNQASSENNIIIECMETDSTEETEQTEAVLQCTVCDRTLKSSSELENHIDLEHAPSPSTSNPSSTSAGATTTAL